ncbi:MAG: DUF448 domain-containing protein [Sulfurovum sp.]
MKKSNPIRMCISCRNRASQSSLIRLQKDEKSIIAYSGRGRSFYLCSNCVTNEKKVNGLVKRFKLNSTLVEKERFSKLLQKLHSKSSIQG